MIEALELAFKLLAPIAGKMVDAIMSGSDPRDVLRDERVADICPAQSETERAMLRANAAKRGGA